MVHRSKQVRGEYVSSWMEEDGCGVVFSRFEESDDEKCDEEYLLLQRHVEEPDDGSPYIETDDERFSGHFRNVTAALERSRLEIRYGSRVVAVAFSISDRDFEGVARAMRAMIPNVSTDESKDVPRQNGG